MICIFIVYMRVTDVAEKLSPSTKIQNYHPPWKLSNFHPQTKKRKKTLFTFLKYIWKIFEIFEDNRLKLIEWKSFFNQTINRLLILHFHWWETKLWVSVNKSHIKHIATNISLQNKNWLPISNNASMQPF